MSEAQTQTPVRPFQLLIKPVGADCNLRCEYCFYLRAHELYGEEKRHCMSPETQETIIQGLLSYRFPETVFSWQGGEPTLAGVDFFRRAVELEQKHGAPGQSVGNAFQTNGVLIDADWCRLFRDYHFLIGLSVDGPAEIHDAHRYNAARRGSFEQAMAAAELMRSNGVEFNILCVVNKDNVELGADLLRWFVDNGFPFVQFIPCVERESPFNVPPRAFGAFLCDTFDYWVKEGLGRVSVRDFEGMLAQRMGEGGGICTFNERCNSYIVVEHDGGVYPCDFFVYDEWRLGNVHDAPLHTFLETDLYQQFAHQKRKVPACRKCEWRRWCQGGCQKDRMAVGRLDEPSALCEAYRIFFAHAQPKFVSLAKRVKKERAKQAAAQTPR